MQNISHNADCDKIEQFSLGLGPNQHCVYNAETGAHNLELNGSSIWISKEEFDASQWEEKILRSVSPE